MRMEGGKSKPIFGVIGVVILLKLFLLDYLNLIAERVRNLL